jgi:hypothetical protein
MRWNLICKEFFMLKQLHQTESFDVEDMPDKSTTWGLQIKTLHRSTNTHATKYFHFLSRVWHMDAGVV